jgi:NADPH:quinone reductase-like Zn-dependent oxidoreductase
MRALQYTTDRNGMDVASVSKPVPAGGEVLVKVDYSALDTAVPSLAKRDIMSYHVHDMKSKPLLAGYHYCGIVEAVGSQVTDLKVGDIVFGHLQYSSKQKQGAFSEYITVTPAECAVKPANVSVPVAAACGTECTTALQWLRDYGGMKAGDSVLILGAGGSVGSVAVQIAKLLGAKHVTAVCSTKDVERVRLLGADEVLDRSKGETPFDAAHRNMYNVVLDTPVMYSYWEASKVLQKGGAFLQTYPSGQFILYGWFLPMFTGKKFRNGMCNSNKADLDRIGKWIDDGALKVEIDSEYNISDFNQAWARYSKNTKAGRVVVKVNNGW